MAQPEHKTLGEKLNYQCYWCALDWGGSVGAIWDCFECEPCCGKPCTFADCCKCFLCWSFCFFCSFGKLYAYSVDQDCACVNHCVTQIFLFPCMCVALRHNLRRKELVGDVCEYWWGDCLMVYCCCPCAYCQMWRAEKPDDWDWYKHINEKGFECMNDNWKFCQPD